MQPELLPKALTVQWLIRASGSYSRASRNLAKDIQNSDLEDIEMCRIINDRIMTVQLRRFCRTSDQLVCRHTEDNCFTPVEDSFSHQM